MIWERASDSWQFQLQSSTKLNGPCSLFAHKCCSYFGRKSLSSGFLSSTSTKFRWSAVPLEKTFGQMQQSTLCLFRPLLSQTVLQWSEQSTLKLQLSMKLLYSRKRAQSGRSPSSTFSVKWNASLCLQAVAWQATLSKFTTLWELSDLTAFQTS